MRTETKSLNVFHKEHRLVIRICDKYIADLLLLFNVKIYLHR